MTDEAKFTPGPWRIAGKSTIRAGQDSWIAGINWRNREANAALVAAAPDLYAALHEITDVYWGVDDDRNGDGQEPPPQVILRARAAILKARGQS